VGGLYIPDNAEKDKPLLGKIIAVGEGRITRDNEGNEKLTPLKSTVGSFVCYGRYAGQAMRVADKTYLIMQEEEVLCDVVGYGALDGESAKG